MLNQDKRNKYVPGLTTFNSQEPETRMALGNAQFGYIPKT
jgi:hypothetical protein